MLREQLHSVVERDRRPPASRATGTEQQGRREQQLLLGPPVISVGGHASHEPLPAGIPERSNPSRYECLAQLAGHVMTQQRNRLACDKAEMLLFVKENLPLIKPEF
ncbi:hypothetical protein KUCAC02_033458 [Chaenocephalus aceratus]|nr:hypothetical protein KUCAC02_033458 [Chaenocephalus aceratus]